MLQDIVDVTRFSRMSFRFKSFNIFCPGLKENRWIGLVLHTKMYFLLLLLLK